MKAGFVGLLTLVFAWTVSTAVSAQSVPVGNPDYPGRLDVIYPDDKNMVQVDGEYLNDATEGKAVREYDQGKHSLKVYARKGLFDATLKQDTVIDIPGGYIVRVTIKKDKLVILDTVPIPGQGNPPAPDAQPAAAPPPSTVSTTTVIGIEGGGSVQFTTTETVPGATDTAPASTPKPVPAKKSKLTFLSDAGQCEVYLDGKRVASLGLSGLDSPAKATVFDLKASTYKIKVTWFADTWYDGKITIGNGEDIKIQIDKDTFDIISRDPL